MPATEAMLSSWYGAYFARATLARNILAPVAGMVRGHPSELHRRCILVRCLPSCTVTGDVCHLFDMFGSIEAIAVSGGLGMAVAVFETAVAECMSAPVLRRGRGFFEPVPPLYLGPPLVLADAMDIKEKFALHPKRALPSPPKSDKDALYLSWFSMLEGDRRGRPVEPTTVFVASLASRKEGPRPGADGQPRFYGTSYTYWRTDTDEYFRMEDASRRAADLDDPHKIPDKIWPYQHWFD